jgi:hypothetical protein
MTNDHDWAKNHSVQYEGVLLFMQHIHAPICGFDL